MEQQWSYYVGSCYFKVTRKGGLTHAEEGYWALLVDKEYTLNDGLALMGKRGWELVSTHPYLLERGGEISGRYYPGIVYIFKKPLAESTDEQTRSCSQTVA